MASGFKAYPFDEIEPKWQAYWHEQKTYAAQDGGDKPKYYILDMFPYPSAAGLHVGHLEGYTATDIIARYKRMRGFNVLHPMGWDAFGLPAEQHAIETGTHPRDATHRNVTNFKRQIQRIGFSYDWDREVNTTDPKYYRWTQWIFRKLFEKGLAYESEQPVNWCPELGTVLANEEVIDGKSERGGHPVIRKPMRQWVLKITAYAERLLEDLELVDWPEAIKDMQRNWIGKSVGAEVDFRLSVSGTTPEGVRPMGLTPLNIRVYTTRPDTLFGATYMVLSPEHKLVSQITTTDQKQAVASYIEAASKKSDLERTELAKEKTGVFTGAYAINPVNGKKIPVWIADYVLASYGTGAIMAVPAHDERDFEFATKFKLSIVEVIESPKGTRYLQPSKATSDHPAPSEAFTGIGTCINSSTQDKSFSIDGMQSDKAKEKITKWLEEKKLGKKSIQYKLRDWLFSRQRYWGEPFPIVHVNGKPQLVKEDELPIALPELDDYKPTGTGEPPLAKATDWLKAKDLNGNEGVRETNTMPQWAGSCWYYLRYLDPNNTKLPVDLDKEKYWMPVDLYVGGAEHAVLHLLYSRFWHKVLYDCGVVSTKEPFHRLINQGMILGEDNQKMSKSRGNVANPDDIVDQYGADSVRLYEMFMGPLEMTKPWSQKGVEGVHRFLARVWRLFVTQENELNPKIVDRKPTNEEQKRIHQTIKKVTEDIEGIRLNTAISALMVFVNETMKDQDYSKEVLEKFIFLLSPFAPHIAEELWQFLRRDKTLSGERWPEFDQKYLEVQDFVLAIMISGKVRAKITVPKGMSEDDIRKRALECDQLTKWIDGKEIKKTIVVPGRMVNIVLK